MAPLESDGQQLEDGGGEILLLLLDLVVSGLGGICPVSLALSFASAALPLAPMLPLATLALLSLVAGLHVIPSLLVIVVFTISILVVLISLLTVVFFLILILCTGSGGGDSLLLFQEDHECGKVGGWAALLGGLVNDLLHGGEHGQGLLVRQQRRVRQPPDGQEGVVPVTELAVGHRLGLCGSS